MKLLISFIILISLIYVQTAFSSEHDTTNVNILFKQKEQYVQLEFKLAEDTCVDSTSTIMFEFLTGFITKRLVFRNSFENCNGSFVLTLNSLDLYHREYLYKLSNQDLRQIRIDTKDKYYTIAFDSFSALEFMNNISTIFKGEK